MQTWRAALIVTSLLLAGAVPASGESQGLTPEGRDRLLLWQDCAAYRTLNDILRANFDGVPLATWDGEPVLRDKLAGESFCKVTRKDEASPYAVAACVWMRYGDGEEAELRAQYERRRKSIPACRSGLKSVLVLPQGSLGPIEQAHFMSDGGAESWSVGFGRMGKTWFIQLHAYGPLQ